MEDVRDAACLIFISLAVSLGIFAYAAMEDRAELRHKAVDLGHAEYVIDENRQAKFQWIDHEEKKHAD